MPEFVLNRSYVLAGKGHRIRFEKNTPTWVPPELVREALGIGAESLDGPQDVLGPEEVPVAALTGTDRQEMFYKAFEDIVGRNASGDFGGDGKPTHAAVAKLVTFDFTKKDMVAAYRQHLADKQEA